FRSHSHRSSERRPLMPWLGEHRRNPIPRSTEGSPAEKVLPFPSNWTSAVFPEATSAVDLVQEAAEMIRGIEERAATVQADAQSVVEDTLERLRLAEYRIHSLEAEQRATEQLMNEARNKLQESEEALKQAQARIADVEAQLSIAEQHAA